MSYSSREALCALVYIEANINTKSRDTYRYRFTKKTYTK